MGASLSGPLDAPGYYNIELLYGDSIKMSTGCFIMPDPRFSDQYLENYASKKQLLDSVIAQVNAMHTNINAMRMFKKKLMILMPTLE